MNLNVKVKTEITAKLRDFKLSNDVMGYISDMHQNDDDDRDYINKSDLKFFLENIKDQANETSYTPKERQEYTAMLSEMKALAKFFMEKKLTQITL